MRRVRCRKRKLGMNSGWRTAYTLLRPRARSVLTVGGPIAVFCGSAQADQRKEILNSSVLREQNDASLGPSPSLGNHQRRERYRDCRGGAMNVTPSNRERQGNGPHGK